MIDVVRSIDAPVYDVQSSIESDEDRIIQQALSILKKRVLSKNYVHTIASYDDVVKLLQLQLFEQDTESSGVIFLTSQNKVIEIKEMFKGTINSCGVYPREIVKHALLVNAASIILYHNHPTGLMKPSKADNEITNKIKAAANTVDINVLDHVIVGANENYFSYAKNKLI